MDNIKTLAYAGLGLAIQTNDKVKAQFNDLVELGKKRRSRREKHYWRLLQNS